VPGTRGRWTRGSCWSVVAGTGPHASCPDVTQVNNADFSLFKLQTEVDHYKINLKQGSFFKISNKYQNLFCLHCFMHLKEALMLIKYRIRNVFQYLQQNDIFYTNDKIFYIFKQKMTHIYKGKGPLCTSKWTYSEDKVVPLGDDIPQGTSMVWLTERHTTVHAAGSLSIPGKDDIFLIIIFKCHTST